MGEIQYTPKYERMELPDPTKMTIKQVKDLLQSCDREACDALWAQEVRVNPPTNHNRDSDHYPGGAMHRQAVEAAIKKRKAELRDDNKMGLSEAFEV